MVIVTGASGFIGSHLHVALDSATQSISLQDPDWSQKLASCKASSVVHLAGITHNRNPENEIQKVNVDGTRALGKEAARNGVKKFIFVSSIQAIGEKTCKGTALKTDATCSPQVPYGRSKLEAEEILRQISMECRMEVVIIRLPLVYGPGVKANFKNLLDLADKGIPLPLNALDANRRSFVGVTNLIDLILICLEHPEAANQTIHVSDDDDISTAELLRRIGKALGKPVRNLPITQSMLKSGLRLVGKGDWVDKLCGDLRVDISETKRLLGWKPKVTMEEELERTARWWRVRKQ